MGPCYTARMNLHRRPEPSEYAPYYGPYIDRVPDGPIADTLERQMEATRALLAGLPEDRADHRYQPGKWSIKEVVGHVLDVERIFATRALAFSRNDPEPYPGMDQDRYIDNARFGARALAGLAAELEALRRSNVHLFRSFDAETLDRKGVASGVAFTARAVPWILAGHELHHMGVLRERYL